MRVAVTGSSGLIGAALCARLEAEGHSVVRVVRQATTAGSGMITWDPGAGTIDAAGLEGTDAVVHLAGAGIGDKRWTDERKRVLLESRTKGTHLLAVTLAGLDQKPAVLVSGSAIGYYGDRGDEVMTEQSPAGDGFLADICVQWEAAAAPAADAGIRVVLARTGIVLSATGGALAKMLPLFRFGVGGPFGAGRDWWSWITLDDEIGALVFLLDHDVEGPVNLTAPHAVRNRELAKTLGHVLSRPSLLPVPAFGPKLLLGGELAEALLFTSADVQPTVLEQAGYSFITEELEPALRSVLHRPAA